MRTGPLSGVARSGVIAVAVPTCDAGGQLSLSYWAAGQRFPSAFRSGVSGWDRGTLADFVPASPGPWVMIVVSGGVDAFAVCPLAPTMAVNFGANGSASQAVGVKLPCPLAAPSPSPTTCSVVSAGPHDVGFVMNALPAPLFARRVRLMLLMCTGAPLTLFGIPLMVEVRPESDGRTFTSDLRCCVPAGVSRRIPSCAGSGLSGTRLKTSPLTSDVIRPSSVMFTVCVPTLLAAGHESLSNCACVH